MINDRYVTGLKFKLMDLQSEALQTALANTAPRTSENANSTILLTETLSNFTVPGRSKEYLYCKTMAYHVWKGGFLILDWLSLSRTYYFFP